MCGNKEPFHICNSWMSKELFPKMGPAMDSIDPKKGKIPNRRSTNSSSLQPQSCAADTPLGEQIGKIMDIKEGCLSVGCAIPIAPYPIAVRIDGSACFPFIDTVSEIAILCAANYGALVAGYSSDPQPAKGVHADVSWGLETTLPGWKNINLRALTLPGRSPRSLPRKY